jgi:hypothetical protein
MGYRPDWIERQLAHVEPNSVQRTCNHAEYRADRAVMMQRWTDLLDEWEKAAREGGEGRRRRRTFRSLIQGLDPSSC